MAMAVKNGLTRGLSDVDADIETLDGWVLRRSARGPNADRSVTPDCLCLRWGSTFGACSHRVELKPLIEVLKSSSPKTMFDSGCRLRRAVWAEIEG
jgi:hypothetical protein